MPDIDPLAFDIAFALTHKPIPAEVRKVIRSLPDATVDHLAKVVAEHLRLCGWRPREPVGVVPSAPIGQPR